MKVYIANELQANLSGGGGSFIRNFSKSLNKEYLTPLWQTADICLIPSATMVTRERVFQMKEAGKKIVLRVDNVLRNSRNRGTGMTRMYDFALIADVVVYQSEWARDFLAPFTKRKGVVILNSSDEKMFNPDGEKRPPQGEPQYLFVRSSTDEGKNWISAWYFFQEEAMKNPKAHIWLLGKFWPKELEYGLDFFGDVEKRCRYVGYYDDPEDVSLLMRSSDYFIYSYLNDACSNTLIEAILSGCKIKFLGGTTGGAIDIMKKWADKGKEYFHLKRMGDEYLELFKSL